MARTKAGGQKTAKTTKLIYGKDWHARIGALGGAASGTGGFYNNRKLASIAGKKGGKWKRTEAWKIAQSKRLKQYWAARSFAEGFNEASRLEKIVNKIRS